MILPNSGHCQIFILRADCGCKTVRLVILEPQPQIFSSGISQDGAVCTWFTTKGDCAFENLRSVDIDGIFSSPLYCALINTLYRLCEAFLLSIQEGVIYSMCTSLLQSGSPHGLLCPHGSRKAGISSNLH